jgi:hypothetical protein
MPITWSIPGVTRGGLTVKLAGVDITSYVDESTVDIDDTLGQGQGTGSGGGGKATVCKMTTTLGPLYGAVGAGTTVSTPTLVRNAPLQVYDANNNLIFGGFVVKYDDVTEKTQVKTTIECHDYWQALDRIIINEIFSGVTDSYVFTYLLNKYAPWVNTSLIQGVSAYQFPSLSFRNTTLQKALQKVCDATGYIAWIGFDTYCHYIFPSQALLSPFTLSETPDFRSSYQLGFDPSSGVEIDDNAIINRVYFYGGKKPSPDFPQDISTQANGNNKIFVLAYYPRPASDGYFHVTVNGTKYVVGRNPGDGVKNTLKSAGGLCDCLINADAKNVTFDVAPAAGATVICTYQYQSPIVTVITDENSRKFFGGYFDGSISDETVFSMQEAVARSRVLLDEQSFGLTTLKVYAWRAGIQAGQLLRIDHNTRNIHDTFLVQEVHTTAIGNGQFQYELTLGSWSWGLVDVLKKAIDNTTPPDDSTDESTTSIDIKQSPDNVTTNMNFSTQTKNNGGYYARSSAVGDGHDAYAGLFSITS